MALDFNHANDSIYATSSQLTFGNNNPVVMDSSGNLKLSGGTILNNSGRAMLNQTGGILQIVQANTTTGTSINSTSLVASNLSGTITPTSSTSKILVLYGIGMTATNSATSFNIRNQIYRSISGGSAGFIGTVTDMFSLDARNSGTIYGQQYFQCCQHYLDSPATTSAVTYTVYGSVTSQSGSAVVGDFLGFIGMGTITMIEVAA